MKQLDHLASAARDVSPVWDDARASRVFTSTLERRDRRVARARVMRRALAIGGAAAFVGILFLRGASASPTSSMTSSTSSSPSSTDLEPTAIAAADSLGDAGYARD